MVEKVHEILKTTCGIADNSQILLAVSGGPDSICLLDIVSRLPYHVTIAHLNHQLRPRAGKESEFVSQRAIFYKMPLFTEAINIKNIASEKQIGIEETARDERYRFLYRIAEKTKSIAVLTAHHADDQIETVLMNFIRGAGLAGLSGMKTCSITPYSHNISLVRPLLEIWKEEILNYCNQNHLVYIEDESNLENIYFRNRIRNQLIPLLSEYNPNVKKTLLRNQKTLERDFRFVLEKAEIAGISIGAKKKNNHISFQLDKFNAIDKALKAYVLRDLILCLKPENTEISYDLIEMIVEALDKNHQTQLLHLEKNLFLLVENGMGIFTITPGDVWESHWPINKEDIELKITNSITNLNDQWSLKMIICPIEEVEEIYMRNDNLLNAFLDRKSLTDRISIRRWRAGDKFQPLGMNGKSTKISDFWINQKIPQRARENWPLIENQESIVWIPGFQPSHQFRITAQTIETLILKLEKRI